MADEAPLSDRLLTVAVVTPEGSAYEGHAEMVVVPAFDGEVAFLPGHTPFVGQLGHGELRVLRPDRIEDHWYLEGGVVQVTHDAVTILAERVLRLASIDVARAEEEIRGALARVPTSEEEFLARDRTLLSARSRLRVVRKHGLEKQIPG